MKTVVEQVKDRLPITEVLSSYLTVVQHGNQYKAKCPFHNERTASFYISPDRGLYYCFGCGAKGDIFSFVSQFEGLDFKGTLKLLAERAGVQLTGQSTTSSDTDALYEILEKATATYESMYTQTSSAQEYLTKRGLTPETIALFRIGYARDEWRTIESLCKTDAERKVAERAGLIKATEGKVYDRFRKRIMFPLCDSSGRVIGFSGRSFPEDEKSPKYLNSPETELFQKSKTLFGFDKAKFHIKKHNFSILVEGQMDLVMSHQAGFKNTVASSGTAVSEDAATDRFSNLSVLSRLSPHIFLAFDGDSAGQKAMDRAALVALSLGMNPKVVMLPEGVDPADYIREHGADAWKGKLKESKHFIEHHLALIKKSSQSPHMFVQTIKEKLFPFLARVASPMEKNLYVTMIAGEIGMPASAIIEELAKTTPTVAAPVVAPIVIRKAEPTAYERLTALRQRFGSELIETIAEALSTLTIGDLAFSAPAVPEERLDRALVVVESEYGSLSDADREKVAKEFVDKVISQFLLESEKEYVALQKTAHSNAEDEEVDRITRILADIQMRKQIHKRSSA